MVLFYKSKIIEALMSHKQKYFFNKLVRDNVVDILKKEKIDINY